MMHRLMQIVACLFCLFFLFFLALPVAGWAINVDMNARQAERYHALTHQLRCLVCQNQSIASSDADLAADLRAQVARKIVAGQGDDQIKQYLVDRYGEWVLYDPPFQWSTWLLWCGPFGLLLIGLGLIYGLTRRRRDAEPSPRPAVDRERLAAVLSESSATQDDTENRERSRDD